MKYTVVLFCFLIGLPQMARPQSAPAIEWQFNYGGSLTELARWVNTTMDGGYIVAATTISSDGDVTDHIGLVDIWVTKLHSDGTMEWQRCYGGTASESGPAMISQTHDGGYILGGMTESNDGDVTCPVVASNIWILKLDHMGGIQWQRCLGGSALDSFAAVRPTLDGGYIVAGGTYSSDGDAIGNNGSLDRLIIKLNMDGSTEWSRCYGGSGVDGVRDVMPTSDGGFIICGGTQSNDGDLEGCNPYYAQPISPTTGWVLKIGASGEIEWQQCIGGTASDFFWRCFEGIDQSFWIIGHTYSQAGDVSGHHGENDGWIVRLDAQGQFTGQRCFGGSSWDEFRGASLLANGNVLTIGYTQSSDGDITTLIGQTSVWILEIDEDLEIVWQKTYGGSNHDLGSAIQATSDGGAVIVGESTSSDGDLTGNNGDLDLWVVKLAPWDVGMDELDWHPNLNIYPSPTRDLVQLEWNGPHAGPMSWEILDLCGRQVAQGRAMGDRWSVPVAQLAPGTYLMRVHGPHGVSGGRFVKE